MIRPRGNLPRGGGFEVGDTVRLKNLGRPGTHPVAHRGIGKISSYESGVWVVRWPDGSTSMEPHYYLKHVGAVDELAELAPDEPE